MSRGRQCVANSLVSIEHRAISGKLLTKWDADDLNSVFMRGDELYKQVRKTCPHAYLNPHDLPQHLCIQHQMLKSSIASVVTWQRIMKVMALSFPLQQHFSFCFGSDVHGGIFICKGSAIALFSTDLYFYVFDPHARGSDGTIDQEGNAVFLTVNNFFNLQTLLRKIFQCENGAPFELYAMKFENVARLSFAIRRDRCCLSMENDAQICQTCKSQMIFSSPNNGDLDLVENFNLSVNTGPSLVCRSCSQTWFKHSVREATGISEGILSKFGFQQDDLICNTCYKYLKSEKIPPCSSMNGLMFPQKPPELDLTSLEERLVAPRIPFMQLREKPRGGQLSITGNVVNVPADVTSTVKKLPRLPSDNETIPLKFKRSMSFKHFIAFENIRPNKVLAATQWLLQNSTLFRAEGIELNEAWETSVEVEAEEINSATTTASSEEKNTADNWTEDTNIQDRATGNMDTVMQSIDFREFNQILSVAPGETNSPLSVFQDRNAEFLAFPTLYCGEVRPDNSSRLVPLHYSTICKWELRNVDRRCAMCIPNLFFKLKRLQIKQIHDKVMLAMRKCKLQGKKYTAAQILDCRTADSIVRLNEGYHVLCNLRGSPPYWEQAKKDLFAMIRQLGLPTWFCSFSAAETKWEPLLRTLGQLVENITYTQEEILNMTWEQKSKLIKSDPVTCARYFDHRFHKFFANVLCHKSNPVGSIEDYFYRIEFQQRGSPHVHMLLWIRGAPNPHEDSDEKVTQFIDEYITCDKQDADDYLINYQTHRHAKTCMKKNKQICRFNFPIPPMPRTLVLAPLEEDDENFAASTLAYSEV